MRIDEAFGAPLLGLLKVLHVFRKHHAHAAFFLLLFARASMHTISIDRLMTLPSSQKCSGQTNHTPANERVDSSTNVPARTMRRQGIGPDVASVCSPVDTKPAIVIIDCEQRRKAKRWASSDTTQQHSKQPYQACARLARNRAKSAVS